MIVCKVWDAEYPWDVRVEKVCRALQDAGHRVELVARNRHRRPLVEKMPEATVHRLRPLPGLGRRLDHALMFPAFFNPRWLRLIHRTARTAGADVILCRDLPLAPAAIFVGKRLGLPVVLDMAENYPAMIAAQWEAGRQGSLDWAVRNPRLIASVERWVLARVQQVFVVVEESRERIAALGVPREKIAIVSNTPPRALVAEPPPEVRETDVLHLVYVGRLDSKRGIDTAIGAVARLRADGVPTRLSIVGSGPEEDLFRRQAQEAELSARSVVFHGFLEHSQAMRVARGADVGLVPHVANEAVNTTVPNKIFDYMALGLPQIVSDAPPLSRIIEETGAGEVFRSKDVEDLARAIRSLLDPARRREASRAGMAAVRARYNWEIDSDRLCRRLERVVSR